MSDDQLRTKLYEMLTKYSWGGTISDTDDLIARIDQAYKDAGYKKPNTPFEDMMESVEIMQNAGIPTGPPTEFSIGMPASGWLARFRSELAADQPLHDP